MPRTHSSARGESSPGDRSIAAGPATDNPTEMTEVRTREFGRDGVSGLMTHDRAVRAREVSRPTASDASAAHDVLAQLLARATGRR